MIDKDKQEKVFDMVRQERERQDIKWGDYNHSPTLWLALAMRQMGHLGRDMVTGTREDCVKEAVQCVSVLIAFCEANGDES